MHFASIPQAPHVRPPNPSSFRTLLIRPVWYAVSLIRSLVVGCSPRRSVRSHLLVDKMVVKPAFPQVPRIFSHQFSILIFQLESVGSMQRRIWGLFLRVVLNWQTGLEQSNYTEHAPRKTCSRNGEVPCSLTDCDNLTPVLPTSTKYWPHYVSVVVHSRSFW